MKSFDPEIFYASIKSHLSYLITARSLRTKISGISSSLVMSGSRGIGGVTCGATNTVDLFDLEEDEDSDEECSGDEE